MGRRCLVQEAGEAVVVLSRLGEEGEVVARLSWAGEVEEAHWKMAEVGEVVRCRLVLEERVEHLEEGEVVLEVVLRRH